jgi:hypothetical protein
VDDPSKKGLAGNGNDTRLTPPEYSSPHRRNTTDLSEFLESEGYSDVVTHHLSPMDSSVTIRLRKSSSFNEETSSSFDLEPISSPTPPPRSVSPNSVPKVKITEENGSEKATSTEKLRNGATFSGDELNLLPSSPGVKKKTKKKRLLIKGVHEVVPESHISDGSESSGDGNGSSENSADVAFIIQVNFNEIFLRCYIYETILQVKSTRKKKDDDEETMSMTTATDTTDTTLIDVNESNSGLSLWEFDELKKELERLKEKCDKLEKEKAEILSRRVSNLEAPKSQVTIKILKKFVVLLTNFNLFSQPSI